MKEEPDCRECGAPATDLDHIDGDRANNERENLRPLCGDCHDKRTYRDQAFGRKARQDDNDF